MENGKRNGKGKEYYDNTILKYGLLFFDGEFLYGHKYKGREYINNKLE